MHRLVDLVRYASDASPYRYIPQAIVIAGDVDDVAKTLCFCRENGRHATFRSGGTSLNGQSQSDDILIEVRRNFGGGITIGDRGQTFTARTGVILAHANAHLAIIGRKLGPDPASGHACTLGGVISNNSGGMRCTVDRDAYHTVRRLVFTLPSGTTIDTGASDAEEQFAALEFGLAEGLMTIRDEVLSDPALVERIRKKYLIRNTHGYHLLAFLDGETPLEIFRRLLTGSEGTLAFISEATFDTLPLPAVHSVAWIPVPSIDEAIALVPGLVGLGASAVELVVAPALRAAGEAFAGTPRYWQTLDPRAAALLVEFGAADDAALEAKQVDVAKLVANTKLLNPLTFTSREQAIELAWHVREGLLGLIGKQRPPGSMIITEDVCFPPAVLATAAHDLQLLLEKHGFLPGVAGHAAHGNLHFTLVAKLDHPEDRARYSAFMDDLVALVVDKYDGSLKAEHGTGLNMAPFLTREWGEKATNIMWRIKALADPEGVLGPNVILSRDDQIHLKALKSVPAIESITSSSQCIECGFCEPVCPSRNVTMTPRQRIVVRREMARQPQGSAMLGQLQQEYQYDGIETCAGDGTCSLPCPIGINTGAFIREFRKKERGPRSKKIALAVASRWALVEKVAVFALGATQLTTRLLGPRLVPVIANAARAIIDNDLMPAVPGPMPKPASRRMPITSEEGAAAVYFPACINRMFGRDPDAKSSLSLQEALVTLSRRAGLPLWIPDDVTGLCCSTPFSSKGFADAHQYMADAIADAFWRWSDKGKRTIVVDAASCTLGIADDVQNYLNPERKTRHVQIRIVDSVSWCRDLMEHLTVTRRLGRVILHPTCSMTHLGLTDALKEIAGQIAAGVEIPIGTTCCGTAGDRGLLHPELVRSATREEATVARAANADAYLSANRTCEMGMRHATGRPYESFVFSLEECTRP
ncbi:MAG TPA: FAD-binding and (Fe-S)-binding domain-containing protein [Rhizomicrobium sp.]|nr:FAD-binding and (Fe-S)-binding domain-containing protein [Rhizomicrobium sp.]